jgi:hypothetical protein
MAFQGEVLAAVRSATILVLAVTATLAVTSPASSRAAVDPTFLEGLPIVDPFSVPESPLSGNGAWSPMITATFTGEVAGADMSIGWGPLSHYPTVNGAAWNRGTAPTDEGAAAVATTLLVPPDAELQNRYFSLWLDMPNSSSAGTTGYELRFTQIEGADTYDVTITRWQAGASTTIAEEAEYVLPAGSSFALADDDSTVSAWTDVGGSYAPLMSASDSTFDSGYTGMAATGFGIRIGAFRSNVSDDPPPNPDPDPEPDPDPDPPAEDPQPDPEDPTPAQNPTTVPAQVSAGAREVARAATRRRLRARRSNGAVVIDTGLTVRCSKSAEPCVARGRVAFARGSHWLSVGSVRMSVPQGTSRRVVVRLSKRGARILRTVRGIKARGSATIRTTDGTVARKLQTRRIRGYRLRGG